MSEVTEWMECELARPGNDKFRYCFFLRTEMKQDHWLVGPETCATCPVPDDRRDAKKWREYGPALVKAVRAVKPVIDFFDALNAYVGDKAWLELPEDLRLILRPCLVACRAALAVLPKGGDRG